MREKSVMSIGKRLTICVVPILLFFPLIALAWEASALLLACAVTNAKSKSAWDATLKVDVNAGKAIFHELTFDVTSDDTTIYGKATEKLHSEYRTRELRLDRVTGLLWIQIVSEGKLNGGIASLSTQRIAQLAEFGIDPITQGTGKCKPAKPMF